MFKGNDFFREYEFNFSYENSNYVTLTSRSNASNFLFSYNNNMK